MNKKIFLLILITFTLPKIAIAAWYNPITWFNNWQFSKTYEIDSQTKTLENRIKELEKKLEDVSTKESVKLVSTTTNSQEPIKKTNKAKVVTPPVLVPPNISVPPKSPQSVRDYKALYNDLYAKFIFFFDKRLDSDVVSSRESNVQDTNKTIHLKNLGALYKKRDDVLKRVGALDPLKFDALESEYKQIVREYELENDRYTKNLVYNFISDNKDNLYLPAIHIQAAQILDLYDRTFGTKYSADFRKLETQVQTTEFANSFLLDIKDQI